MIEQLVKQFIAKYDFDNYVIAYSGGVDSQVLLHAFAKIVPEKVIAFHVNHGISDNAKTWQDFCSTTAQSLSVAFKFEKFNLLGESNLEDKARKARYGAFESVMNDRTVLVTGHHMDDQVETFMLNLMRGAGLDGLSAMPEIKSFGDGFHGRPFLSIGKEELTEYAVSEGLQWVEDESNKDSVYDRNFIRNEVVPLLKTRWKNASSSICNSVEHIQNAKQYIDNNVKMFDTESDTISIQALQEVSDYEQVQIVRKWVANHIGQSASQNMLNTIFNEIIPARDDAKMKWEQKNYFITRYNGELHFVKKEKKDYDIAGILTDAGFDIPVNEVVVKNRVNGATIKQGNIHKEVKKLFSELKVPTWLREDMPFIYHNDELISVGGIINRK
jgi:tRNA(Ile)-lysidine synthase